MQSLKSVPVLVTFELALWASAGFKIADVTSSEDLTIYALACSAYFSENSLLF